MLFWVGGFDILYALQDEQIDRAAGLSSVPAKLGRRGALAISRMCHAATLAAFIGVGITGHFHTLFWIGFALAAVLLLIEQSLVKPHDISKVNIAFMSVNGLVGLIFGILAILDLMIF